MSKLIVGASSLAPISYLGLFKLKSLKIYEIDPKYIVYNHKLKFKNSTLLSKRTNDFSVLEKAYNNYKS
ncbi:MAG: hypothetical protein IKP71_07470 [Candidatus Riflebacteria bacterium]|nr:hypothetical protein [Candidatus Riflebacteria bacterium]